MKKLFFFVFLYQPHIRKLLLCILLTQPLFSAKVWDVADDYVVINNGYVFEDPSRSFKKKDIVTVGGSYREDYLARSEASEYKINAYTLKPQKGDSVKANLVGRLNKKRRRLRTITDMESELDSGYMRSYAVLLNNDNVFTSYYEDLSLSKKNWKTNHRIYIVDIDGTNTMLFNRTKKEVLEGYILGNADGSSATTKISENDAFTISFENGKSFQIFIPTDEIDPYFWEVGEKIGIYPFLNHTFSAIEGKTLYFLHNSDRNEFGFAMI